MDASESHPSPDLPDMPGQIPRDNILQDDGVHMLVSTKDVEGSRCSGILLRRCAFSLSAPLGCEFLGQYKQMPDGDWLVSMRKGGPDANRKDNRSKETPGVPQVRICPTELDAMVHLWANRRVLDLSRAL